MTSIITQSNIETLPKDVLFEILTNVNFDDLPACRQINHEFNKITKEPIFKSQHREKTNMVSGYLIRKEQYNQFTLSCYHSFISDYPTKCPIDSLSILKDVDTTIEAVSQSRGLICCFNDEKERYYVCKPATGQCRSIPNPKLRYRTIATAMVVSSFGPINFKIIRLSKPNNDKKTIFCEIFDSRSWTWHRSKNIPKSICFPGEWFDRKIGAVFAGGSVHWLISDHTGNKSHIFTFDVDKETWKMIPVPARHIDSENKWRFKIIARDGKLCYVMLKDADEMIIYTMERYNGKLWWRKEKMMFNETSMKESWLELYMEFIYCGDYWDYEFFADLWEKFWKTKLMKYGLNNHFAGDVFKIESDFTHCECLR